MDSPLIEALRDPSCYPHPVEHVEVIETHISWVLLAGERAYKIKKPVDFGFLDFSTLEQRRHFCNEEVRLNRRTAPDLYLGVVRLTGSAECPSDRLRIDGPGEAVEYAVAMRRFDLDDGFDRLLAAGRFEPAHAEALGEALAGLHEQAEVAGVDSPWGTTDEVIGPMRDNFTTLLERLDDPSRRRRLEALGEWTEQRFAALAGQIARRRDDGFVRECHGDVHLGNVTLFAGRTTLFDCIEFSPALRWTDVMADLAFVIMDLRDRGEEAGAWRLLDRYLDRTGDYAGLALLDFYVVYRAMVRAKVAALGLEPGLEADRAAAILAAIDRYLSVAEQVAQTPRPALVLTCGVSGSGKSHLAARLVAECGLVRLRSDVERKRLFGLAAEQRSGSALDAGLYTRAAGEQTYAHLLDQAANVTAAGFAVLVDATFLSAAQRAPFLELAVRRGIPCGVVVCSADEQVLRDRVQRRSAAGHDASEADEAVLARQLTTFQPCRPDEAPMMEIDSAGPDPLGAVADWLRSLRGTV